MVLPSEVRTRRTERHMSDEGIAFARRLFLHVKDGGSITAMDLSRLVQEMEALQTQRDVAQAERLRLADELARTEKAILPWFVQVGHLIAAWDRHTQALRRIAMPGKEIGYCRDGHEIAVLIARDALKEAGRD